jgi:hypothetical protein
LTVAGARTRIQRVPVSRILRWLPKAGTLAWAVPAALSLVLSAFTVGDRVYWQDSGFYLAAVKELGILYPHGFVLFLLLCKAWTLVLFFVPFTLAVHLFSAACASCAAGMLAAAARDLLRSSGPLLRVSEEDPGEQTAGWVGGATGCLAAAGYTFWSAAIYAKSYAFLYVILAALLWAMIRADADRTPARFRLVAVLIGLAWQAHPSAALLGPALILFVASHRAVLGLRGILTGAGLAAAVALGPTLLLPLLAARDTAVAFGDPTSFREWLPYVTGSRFAVVPGVFGLDETRVQSLGRFCWEELLGGVPLALLGLFCLARRNRRLLIGAAAWVLPQLGGTLLFKIEGQHDLWFVSSWLVLWLASAVGLGAVVERRPTLLRWIAGGVAAAGVLWGVAANGRDVNLRGYDLAEKFGRLHFAPLEAGSILILISDDATALARYLQAVEGFRRDVLVIHETELEEGMSGQPSFYFERLRRRSPYLRLPDFAKVRAQFPGLPATFPGVAAFLNANADALREHPIYLQRAPAAAGLLRADFALAPVGVLQKLVRRGETPENPGRWTLPMEPAEVLPLLRRERGQIVNAGPQGIRVRPEAYEHRLLAVLAKARRAEADVLAQSPAPADLQRAAGLYAMLRETDPSSRSDRLLALSLVRSKLRLGRGAEEEALLDALLRSDPPPEVRAEAACLRGEILRAAGLKSEAGRWFREALSVAGLEPSQRQDLERRAKVE